MGKRSSFERNERDYYPTPYKAILPLLPHLPPACRFIEPCAGDGRLIAHLARHGHSCAYACDIEPLAEGIEKRDILFFDSAKFPDTDYVITNTPWAREPLHKMINIFRGVAPAWLLLDSDYAYTGQAYDYLQYCEKIVSVGRVQWIEGSASSGMENASWYLFGQNPVPYSQFYAKK